MAPDTAAARTLRTSSATRITVSTDDRAITSSEDWDSLESRIEATPPTAMIRGMFLREVLRLAGPRAAASEARYVPFSLYPVRDYMSLLLRTAKARHPGHPAPRALLELGLGVYQLFASSIAGTAIFSVANVDFKSVCELSPKAYTVTLKPGRARAVDVSHGKATIELRDVWVFPEIFHTGIWLGAMDATRTRGRIEVTRHSLCDVDLHLTWDRR